MDCVTSPPYTTRQLRRYHRYPTLYAERRYPNAPHPLSQVYPPFRLLDLPPELRILTYAAALTLPFSIELWPETDHTIASHQLTTANRNMQYLKAKMRQRGVNLGLLRVCKQIRHEAIRCFYENEWRFSGTNGWMVAHAFLFTTRVFGWQHIRSMTLPLPFQLSTQGQLHQGWGKVRPAMSNRAVVRLANHIPFATPKDWTYTGSVVDVCCALGECENLCVVNLVLPGWYNPDSVDEAAIQKFMEQVEKLRDTSSRDLKIQLVRVSKELMIVSNLTVLEAKQWEFMQECRKRGWERKKARCDKFGRFNIEDE